MLYEEKEKRKDERICCYFLTNPHSCSVSCLPAQVNPQEALEKIQQYISVELPWGVGHDLDRALYDTLPAGGLVLTAHDGNNSSNNTGFHEFHEFHGDDSGEPFRFGSYSTAAAEAFRGLDVAALVRNHDIHHMNNTNVPAPPVAIHLHLIHVLRRETEATLRQRIGGHGYGHGHGHGRGHGHGGQAMGVEQESQASSAPSAVISPRAATWAAFGSRKADIKNPPLRKGCRWRRVKGARAREP